MNNVYIYESDANDFSSIGLVGALTPFSCIHEEEAGGTSAITMEHPFDDAGKWQALARGRVLKVMTRVRTTPEIQNGQIVTSVEVWTVKSTATKAERGVYSKETGGRRKKTLQPGTQVVVVRKEEERYKIETIQEVRITSLRGGKTGGGVSGWIAASALDYDTTEIVNDIEDVAAPWVVREQLFRITDVQKDTESGKLVVFAPHISYDLIGNTTRFDTRFMEPYKSRGDETITAQEALDGILGNCDFPHEFTGYTDIANTRAGAQYRDWNPMQALLDKENGFCERFGAELVRDDYELYLLSKAGRNRGLRIEYGRNLLGVDFETDLEELVTAIKPIGETKNGKDLYLTDDEASPNNYVLSSHVGEYPVRYSRVLKCEDCKIDGKQLTKELVRARMREQAERMFEEEECDLPNVNLTVKFLLLGDTEEFAQYRDLDRVYLWDEVAVVDKAHGIEALTEVQRIVVDCLTGRVQEVELGNVRECAASLSAWQIPTLDGHKLQSGSVPGAALEDESIPPEKLDPDLQEALSQAFADIEAAQAQLTAAAAQIEAAQTMLGTMDAGLNDARTWLQTLDTGLEAVAQGVVDNAGNISGLSQTATQLSTAITNAQGDISGLRQTATGLESSVASARGDISGLQQTATQLSAAISNTQGDVSTLQQTATQLSTAITTAQGDISSLRQTATELSTALASAQGDISTIRQTANSVSSTVSSLSGSITSIQQTVSSISQTVSGTGGLASQISQLSDRVAIRLYNANVSNAFEAVVGNPSMGGAYAGLEFKCGNLDSPYGAIGLMNAGGLFSDGLNIYGRTDLEMSARGQLWLSAGGNITSNLVLKYDERKAAMSAVMTGHFLPESGNAFDLGGDGNGMRWRKLYCNNAVDTSDIRQKHEIKPLAVGDLLKRLDPVSYRLNDDPDRIRYGFIAQDVISALVAEQLVDSNLIDDENPEHLGLVYKELIAVLVDGWQRHEQEIAALRARIETLEASA